MNRIANKGITLIMVFAWLASTVSVFAQDLTSARYLTRSEKYDEAEKTYNDMINKEPNNSDYYYFAGENYLESYFADTVSMTLKEAVELARVKFQKGMEIDTANALNFVGMGRIAVYQGDMKTAKMYFDKAKAKLPKYKKVAKIENPQKHSMVLTKIAESYLRTNATDTAIVMPLLREAQLIDPQSFGAYLVMGDFYLAVNDGTNAKANFNKAQNVDPKSPLAKIKNGNIYLRAKNFNEAILLYEDAIKIDSTFAPVYRELGVLYSMVGRYEKSKLNYRKYLQLSGDKIPAKLKFVNALFKSKKDQDEMLNEIEEILKVDKSRNYLNRIGGYACYDKENPDYLRGRKYMETFFANTTPDKIIGSDYYYYGRLILKSNPEKDFIKMQADTAKLNKEYRAKSEDFAKAPKGPKKDKIKTQMDSVSVLISNLNTKLAAINTELDKGFENLKKALEAENTNIEYATEIANNYYKYRRFNEAAEAYQKQIDMGKKETKDYMQLGKSYYQAKNYPKADEVFTGITTRQPDFIEGYLWIANTYGSMDPDSKEGLAKPKFEILLEKASADTVKNSKEIFEAYRYLGSYYTFNEKEKDFQKAKMYYGKMISLDPKNKQWQIQGYSSLGLLYGSKMKDFSTAKQYYQKVLEIDPANKNAQSAIDELNKVKN